MIGRYFTPIVQSFTWLNTVFLPLVRQIGPLSCLFGKIWDTSSGQTQRLQIVDPFFLELAWNCWRYHIWSFFEIGLPPVIIHLNGIFPYRPSIWGYPRRYWSSGPTHWGWSRSWRPTPSVPWQQSQENWRQLMKIQGQWFARGYIWPSKHTKNDGTSPNFWWVNKLCLWPLSIAFCMFTREYF